MSGSSGFGKINFKLTTKSVDEIVIDHNNEKDKCNENLTSDDQKVIGFGTFGKKIVNTNKAIVEIKPEDEEEDIKLQNIMGMFF